MMDGNRINVAVIGASGYTGAEVLRLLALHPNVRVALLIANSHAGRPLTSVFPHLSAYGEMKLDPLDDADWSDIDVAFSCLPHATSQQVLRDLPDDVRLVDLSADFRIRDNATYQKWYGIEHTSPELLKNAVYGLTEHNRDAIASARLAACPGCYPTAALLALLPLVTDKLIDVDDIVIDAKSGISGAGRSLKETLLFCERAEGFQPYSVGAHRHAPEIEQEISIAAGRDTIVSFTPHLVPMNRGELVTLYLKFSSGRTIRSLRDCLKFRYENEPFVTVVEEHPSTHHVRGSNFCFISMQEDRIPGRAIVFSTLDNLVKGSAGQGIQNMNVMFGIPETTGLLQVTMFP